MKTNYDKILEETINELKGRKPSLLLHSCCAPCSTAVITRLKDYFDVTIFYYNPNIEPLGEYLKRKEEQKRIVSKFGIKFLDCDYENEIFKSISKGLEDLPEGGYRCHKCYELRLTKTALTAKENNFEYFGTTLTVSPYKNSQVLNAIGKDIEELTKVKFLYSDFKKKEGYKLSIELSKKYNLYRQNYCGCIYSEEMRYYNRNPIQTSNTNGYEIPKEPRMQVKKIENKEDYIDLLLEADPSKDMIHKYLNDSDVYALKKEDELISIAVILHIDRKTLELKNIVTKENYRNKGYAKTLLKSLCGNYKQKYDRMLVGTTENNIPFYVKQGFDKYEKTIKNFFIDNYKEEIKDGELTCTDLIYYSKDLKKK